MKLSKTVLKNVSKFREGIIRGVNEGLSNEGIAGMVGISVASVIKYRNILGLDKVPLSKTKIGIEIMSRYLDGESVQEIYANMGISISTVYKLLNEVGITPEDKKKLTASRVRKASKDARTIEIVERRRKGETLKSIGDSLGITRERVRQICKIHCPDYTVGAKEPCKVCADRRKIKGTWTRDLMIKIMALRDSGSTWAEVGETIGNKHIRQHISQHKNLLSSDEIAKYLPSFEEWMAMENKFRNGMTFSSRGELPDDEERWFFPIKEKKNAAIKAMVYKDGVVYSVTQDETYVKNKLTLNEMITNPYFVEK